MTMTSDEELPASPHDRILDYARWPAVALDDAIGHRDVYISDLDDLITRLEARTEKAKERRAGYATERTAMRIARAGIDA